MGHLCTCQGPSDSLVTLVTLVPEGQALSSLRTEDRKPRRSTLGQRAEEPAAPARVSSWPPEALGQRGGGDRLPQGKGP